MTSVRDLESRLEDVEHTFTDPAATSVDLTEDVKAGIREILRYRRELAAADGQPIELTPALIQEAIEHMDDDLAAAIREADLQ